MNKWLIPALFALFSPFLAAHPHSFLDMKTHILIENNQLQGFEMAWTLDEIASSELIYEIKANPNKKEARQIINDDLTKTAVESHYFSYLYDEKNQPIKFLSKPKNPHFEVKDNRVTFFFRADVAHPPAVEGRQFRLFTYEPSYYLSMTYEKPQDLSVSENTSCSVKLEEPKANSSLKKYASALDKSETPDMPSDDALSLGAQFAQKVSLICK